MDAITLAIFAVLFLVLLGLVVATVSSDERRKRVLYGTLAMMFAAIAFFFTGMVVSFNLNAWYSNAADKLIESSVKAMEEGRQADVLREWKAMDKKFRWRYETRGNFRAIAEDAIQGMNTDHTANP